MPHLVAKVEAESGRKIIFAERTHRSECCLSREQDRGDGSTRSVAHGSAPPPSMVG